MLVSKGRAGQGRGHGVCKLPGQEVPSKRKFRGANGSQKEPLGWKARQDKPVEVSYEAKDGGQGQYTKWL